MTAPAWLGQERTLRGVGKPTYIRNLTRWKSDMFQLLAYRNYLGTLGSGDLHGEKLR